MKILVVDDEQSVLRFLERFFKVKGHHVAARRSGQAAIAFARDNEFDLALIDFRMPRLDGMETLRELRKLRAAAAYVMMTGYAVEELQTQAVAEGAVATIRKPFDIDELLALLGRAA